ncbi:MAG: amidohydrolase family protein [Bacteroidia bacterium]
MKYFSLCAFFLFSAYLLVAQERQPVVKLTNKTPNIQAFTKVNVQISPDKLLQNATVLVQEGIIIEVGQGIAIPKEAAVRELNGAYLYAGWIDAASDCGLKPIKREFNNNAPQYDNKNKNNVYWNEAIKSHLSLAKTYTQEAKAVEELRKAGFTVANVLPNDGIMRGTGFLMNLGSKDLNQELLNAESSVALSFRKGSSNQAYPSALMGSIALLRQTFYDAEHYKEAKESYEKNPAQNTFLPNLSLEALLSQQTAKLPFIFETESWQHTLAAAEIAKEFQQPFVYRTNGDEYKRLQEFKALNTTFIVPLKFPKAFETSDVTEVREISLEALKAWEQAPYNLAWLKKEKIPFALTASNTPIADFKENLQKLLKTGITEEDILRALTVTPAKLLGMEKQLGTIEKGKIANFILSSDKLLNKESQIYEVYIRGERYEINPFPKNDLSGVYEFSLNQQRYELSLMPKKAGSYESKLTKAKDTTAIKHDFSLQKESFNLVFKSLDKDSLRYQLNAIWLGKTFEAVVLSAKGERNNLSLNRIGNASPKAVQETKETESPSVVSPITYPNKGFGFTELPKNQAILIKNATIWTNTKKGILKESDVLLENGKISQIGKGLKTPANGRVIDGTGKYLTNGIIDEHSHIGILQGVNEYSHSVTAEVRIGDALDAEDINIYRQLSGGVTAAQLLHGSANPIGGQSQIIKLKWGATPQDMKFKNAGNFIKFALGENVKQSNAGDNMRSRYPQTRLGVEQMMQDAFRSAKDYRKMWEEWNRTGKALNLMPPKKDLQLETLLEILDGKRFITCHSYVQSEIVMLMRLAEAEGFKVNTFTHILEGYKVADKMKKHGANASSFSDWWGYKYEVLEAIPHNPGILTQKGVNVCINSDDAEMGRRLNQEAAKSVKYTAMSEEDAWKMVTLNPAKALHLDEYVGTIETGKDADLVLWTDNPLSVYSKVLYTFIEGFPYFDYEKDAQMRDEIRQEKARILQKMAADKGEKANPAEGKKDKMLYHCDTEIEYH